MRENLRQILINEPGDVWFFVYGSLMWNPGFEPKEKRQALLRGWHRRFCVASTEFRGTFKKPGLSLGLDCGGSCRGLAFCIAESDRDEIFTYLEKREMKENIYKCRKVKVSTEVTEIFAYTLTVNRDHKLYVASKEIDKIVHKIREAKGIKGKNKDYLESTVKHLDRLGIKDKLLHTILKKVVSIA